MNKGQTRQYISDVGVTLRNPRVILIYVATVVTFILVAGAYLNYLPLHLGIGFHASPFVIGMMLFAMTFAGALSSSQMGMLVRIIPERHLFKIGFLLYGIALSIIPLLTSTWLFLIPATIFGIAQGINLPTMQTLLGEVTEVNNRALVMSLYGTSMRLGQTLGPLAAALFLSFSGMTGVFLCCAGLAGAMVVLLSFTSK
jgi:predicted MFS family arabinose efflux permease